MSLTFPAHLKLNNQLEIDRVFSNGKKITGNRFVIFVVVNDLAYSRFCVIAAKKNIKLAVNRNAFKRTARESFRINQHKVLGFDIIVLAYREADKLSKTELHQSLDKQWQKLSQF